MAPSFEKPVQEQQADADADGRIGEVEARPVPAGVVEVEEVGHAPMPQPVHHVAERATGDKAQGGSDPGPLRAGHPGEQQGHDREGDGDEHPPTGLAPAGEQAEGHAGVAVEGQVEEGGDGSRPRRPHHDLADPPLGALVESEGGGEGQEAGAEGVLAGAVEMLLIEWLPTE